MLDNPNPIIHEIEIKYQRPSGRLDDEDIYNVIRSIKDPEHPYTLEQLRVVSKNQILMNLESRSLCIRFTPTVPHCSLSPLIGLMMRVKLQKYLPPGIKVHIQIQEGSHYQELEINKQLNDKERVAAAMENTHLMDVVEHNIAD
jgi:metal-sulfur cluster biosynthetic enzyme